MFYKECSKLLMMLGALMIIFALTKGECKEVEEIRNKATRNAIFLTVLFIFGGMLYRVAQGDLLSVDSSSLLIFPFIQEISAARQHPTDTHSP